VLICALLILCSTAFPKERRLALAQPNQFEIGRHTFFDFGPPFDFYELFVVRPTANGASIERITLTPAGDECVALAPAKLETASASISEPVAALLGSANPCTIPEKELRRELKRRRHGLVFSGADVVMQVECGAQTRLIRSDILDRDMFDPTPNTPEYTSWTMRLLARLDQAVGPGVMDKPIFPILQPEGPPARPSGSVTLQDLGAGKYDVLLQGAPDKPSELYHAAQNRPPPPNVRLLSSEPIPPEVLVEPDYPPLAKMARVEGVVSFKIVIDTDGRATNLVFESGHPLLRETVKKAVASWRFPKTISNQRVQATLEFNLNCPKRTK
jgi:protein TonB